MLSKSFHIYFTIYTCIKAHSSAHKTNIRFHINYISTRKEESISYNSKENQERAPGTEVLLGGLLAFLLLAVGAPAGSPFL